MRPWSQEIANSTTCTLRPFPIPDLVLRQRCRQLRVEVDETITQRTIPVTRVDSPPPPFIAINLELMMVPSLACQVLHRLEILSIPRKEEVVIMWALWIWVVTNLKKVFAFMLMLKGTINPITNSPFDVDGFRRDEGNIPSHEAFARLHDRQNRNDLSKWIACILSEASWDQLPRPSASERAAEILCPTQRLPGLKQRRSSE